MMAMQGSPGRGVSARRRGITRGVVIGDLKAVRGDVAQHQREHVRRVNLRACCRCRRHLLPLKICRRTLPTGQQPFRPGPHSPKSRALQGAHRPSQAGSLCPSRSQENQPALLIHDITAIPHGPSPPDADQRNRHARSVANAVTISEPLLAQNQSSAGAITGACLWAEAVQPRHRRGAGRPAAAQRAFWRWLSPQ